MMTISRKAGLLVLPMIVLLGPSSCTEATVDRAEMVKAEFLHAWNAYKQYAWGHDALKPLSKQPHDWYGVSLLMTPVDAFDTMLLMGLTDEAAEAKSLILDNLTFDHDVEVQVFEVTIRHLGGLISAYQMDGDERFLALAEDLCKRLLPAFRSATGMPYRYVNLRTGALRDSINNPAEVGTLLLEFGTISKLTGNPLYYETAKRALVEVYNRRSKLGLVGTLIDVETGEWVNATSHIGGRIDSYYEYLLKGWLLFGDRECKEMWEESIHAVNAHVADTTRGGLWYGRVDMHTGERVATRFGALEAFFPGVLVLSGDLERARLLQESCYNMWTLHGIEPEQLDYATMTVTSKGYVLRPEAIESAYYLFRITGDARYREMGETFFDSIVQYCRTEAGYAHLSDVITKEKSDAMESFFLAETLKYLYLLFAPPATLRVEEVVFNTEAHPIRRTWND
jgi:mannosidase alpha-like ER degradation enhancer 2